MQSRKKLVAIALIVFSVIVVTFVVSTLFFDSSQVQSLGENQTTKFDLDLVCEVTNKTHNFGITCTESSDISKQYADLTITLTNVGDSISKNTKVLLFIHNEKSTSSPMIVQSIDFADMEPKSQGGESITKNVYFESFNVDSKEIISVVIIDDSEQASQQNIVDDRVNLSSQIIQGILDSIYKYLENQTQYSQNSGYTTVISWHG